MVIPIVIGALGTIPKGWIKESRRVGNRRTSRDPPNYSIIEIGQNTEKHPGNLMGLAVTPTLEKAHQQMLM